MEQKSFLAIFAHPDDESFGVAGTFLRYSAEGVQTALVCATRGEEGEISDPTLATRETLGRVREQELHDACAIMGVRDLSFLDYHDGRLAQADVDEATGRIVWQIRRLRPQVIATFDANGGYGHVDHIAIHNLTVAAFRKAGDPACYPDYPEQLERGVQPYAPQKLYAVAFPRSVMTAMRQRSAEAGIAFQPGGDQATISVEQMGTADERITTALPLDDARYAAKLRAMRAHRTQLGPDTPFVSAPPDELRPWLGTERYVLLYPQEQPDGGIESDLFANVAL